MIEYEIYLDNQPVIVGEENFEIELPREPEFSYGRILGKTEDNIGPVGFDLPIGKWRRVEHHKIKLNQFIIQSGFRPHYLFVPILGKQLAEKLYHEDPKYRYWFDVPVFIKYPKKDPQTGEYIRDNDGKIVYEIKQRIFVLAPIQLFDINGEYLGQIEINEELPVFLEQKKIYFVLLASLPYFLNQTLCTLGYDQVSDFKKAFYLAFSRALYHPAIELYIQHLQLNSWEELIQWASSNQHEINPGQPVSSTTTTNTQTTSQPTTTTRYQCKPVTSTTTSQQPSTTSPRPTTTTPRPAQEDCEKFQPVKELWYVNGWPTCYALDAFLSQICRYAWVEGFVYILPLPDNDPVLVPADENFIYYNTGYGNIRKVVVYCPECDGVGEDRQFSFKAAFQYHDISVRLGGNLFPVTELLCCSGRQRLEESCVYETLLPFWHKLARTLPSWKREVNGFLLDEWEKVESARLNLPSFHGTLHLVGLSSLPQVYARACSREYGQTTTTTAQSYHPPQPPGSTTTPSPYPPGQHPCNECLCVLQCLGTGMGWSITYSECEEPCRCPAPKSWEYPCEDENASDIITVNCTEKEDRCEDNWAEWQWVQTGSTYSEGHWQIKTACPEGCYACYPDFCCEDEFIGGGNGGEGGGTTTSAEPECKFTWTQCVKNKDDCPTQDTWPRDCRVCKGTCTWYWDGSKLTEYSQNCSGVQECKCCPPTSEELKTQHGVDSCEELQQGKTIESKCGTDQQCKERGELADCAKKCEGKCTWRKDLNNQFYLESDECVDTHGKDCKCCPPTAEECTETQQGSYVETSCSTDCDPAQLPEECQGLEKCDGECEWEYVPNVGWVQYEDKTCPEGCACCPPKQCQEGIVKTQCYRNLNTDDCWYEERCPELDEECRCTTTTAPPPPPRNCTCDGVCRFYSYGGLGWMAYARPCCPECPCESPGRMPGPLCDYAITYCVSTTTPPPPPPARGPCYGTCYWIGVPVDQAASRIVWILSDLSWCSLPFNTCKYVDECGNIRYLECSICGCQSPSEGTRLQCRTMCVFECYNGTWVQRTSCEAPLCTCAQPNRPCTDGEVFGSRCEGVAVNGECGEMVVTGCACRCPRPPRCWSFVDRV